MAPPALPTKEQILVACESRIATLINTADVNYFFKPDHVVRIELPDFQYLEDFTIFPENSDMVYFIADEEGLDEEEATEDEMSEEMELYVAVYRRIPSDAQVVNPFEEDYYVKSTDRAKMWSDFHRIMKVPDSTFGLGFVENVNITDNRPLWVNTPEEQEQWAGILFRVTVTFAFNAAEPWAT